MSKMSKAAPMYDTADSTYDDGALLTSVQLRIGGLRPAGDGEFVLEGVKVRVIDWKMVAAGLKRDVVPDSLADQIDSLCFRYDVAEIITERMERTG